MKGFVQDLEKWTSNTSNQDIAWFLRFYDTFYYSVLYGFVYYLNMKMDWTVAYAIWVYGYSKV